MNQITGSVLDSLAGYKQDLPWFSSNNSLPPVGGGLHNDCRVTW